MSCYNCAKSFSLLNRERACKKCGFAFCGNCLKNKMILPDPESGKMSEKSVCSSCHLKMSQPQSSKMIRPPPDALIRRLESLETPPNPPITVYSKKLDRLKRGMSKEDAQIAERLEKLQSDRKTSEHGLPSDHEMEKRLAKLKGEDTDQSVSSTGSVLTPKPAKSDVEQTVDLLSKIVDEVKLDQRLPKPDDEIAERLARLRGQEHVKEVRHEERDVQPEEFLSKFPKITNSKGENPNTPIDIQRLLEEVSEENESDARQAIEAFETDQDLQKQLKDWRQKKKEDEPEKMEVDDEEGDEQEAAKMVERVMAEAALEDEDDEDLDDRIPAPPSKGLMRQLQRAIRLSESSDKDSDELPWCTICNEDASLRCRGCQGDLYCRRCFRECHQEDIDLRDHKVEDYKAPPAKSS